MTPQEKVRGRYRKKPARGDGNGAPGKKCNRCGEVKDPDEFYWRKPGQRYAQCKQCISEKNKAWRSANPEKAKALRKRYVERHPEKARAKWILNTRVAEGRIKKPSTCEGCGKEGDRQWIHAHHHDYSKPVDVRWLCPACHAAEHYEPKAEAVA